MSKPAHKQDDPAKKPGQIQYGLALESGEFIPADQLPIRGQAKYLRDVIGRIQQEEKLEPYQQWLVERRIACPEAGYPASEAQFLSVEEYNAYRAGLDKPKQDVYTIKGGQTLEQWKESVQFVCGVLRHEGWIELNKLLDKLQKV